MAKSFLYFLLIIFLLQSCVQDKDEGKYKLLYEKLSEEHRIDSMLLAKVSNQRNKFDSIYNEIETAYADVQKDTLINKKNFLEKLDRIDKIVVEYNDEIEKLTKELEQNKSKNYSASIAELQNKKKQIEVNGINQVNELRTAIEKLKGENVTLKGKLAGLNLSSSEIFKEREMLAKEIRRIKRERKKLEQAAQNVVKTEKDTSTAKTPEDLTALKDSLKKAQEELTSGYMVAGDQLVDIVTNQKKFLGLFEKLPKDAKSEIAELAFDYYCKAHKRGNYEALKKITDLKANKSLGKFIANKNCE
jgi:chromosome segregation ATPase